MGNIDSRRKIQVQLHEDTFPFAGQLLANNVSNKSLNTATDIESITSPQSSDVPKRFSIKGNQYWQIGPIQQLWFTSYSSDTTIKPAIIIPDLQQKASVISLSYILSDLIPSGDTQHPFNPKKLAMAHSMDGKTWKILKSSVVDDVNNSVGAVGKVGGYYMIVSGAQGVGAHSTTLFTPPAKTLGATTVKESVTIKQAKTVPSQAPQPSSPKKASQESLFLRILNFVRESL